MTVKALNLLHYSKAVRSFVSLLAAAPRFIQFNIPSFVAVKTIAAITMHSIE